VGYVGSWEGIIPCRHFLSDNEPVDAPDEPVSDVEHAIGTLYGIDPASFTKERDALARRLRVTDREAAAAVKALRRPPVTAWALNRVAREQPGDIAALVGADAALATAQREGAGREALAAAGAARRDVIRRLLDAAMAELTGAGHPGTPATRDRMALTLSSIAVDAGGREALVHGRLAGDLTPESLWDTAPASPTEAPAEAPAGNGGPAPAPEGTPEMGVGREALTSRAEALAQAAAAAEDEAARAEEVAKGAEEEAARGGDEARRTEDEARKAAVAAERAHTQAVRAKETAAAARTRAQSLWESAGMARRQADEAAREAANGKG
jgi:hypothetical protein